mmetsp:Transcript_2406/g.5559  ORF Transcript_2406/g.5559 Transcript_2406/m.5559 type:complete len:221 (-) Transcript_2406:638-1300(-)
MKMMSNTMLSLQPSKQPNPKHPLHFNKSYLVKQLSSPRLKRKQMNLYLDPSSRRSVLRPFTETLDKNNVMLPLPPSVQVHSMCWSRLMLLHVVLISRTWILLSSSSHLVTSIHMCTGPVEQVVQVPVVFPSCSSNRTRLEILSVSRRVSAMDSSLNCLDLHRQKPLSMLLQRRQLLLAVELPTKQLHISRMQLCLCWQVVGALRMLLHVVLLRLHAEQFK